MDWPAVDLTIVGWWPGTKKVSLTRLLSRELGLPVRDAKDITDTLLARSDVAGHEQATQDGASGQVLLREAVVLAGPDRASADRLAPLLEELGLVMQRS